MKIVVATGVFGAAVIAVLTEVMNVCLTFTALDHAAAYNAWMAM